MSPRSILLEVQQDDVIGRNSHHFPRRRQRARIQGHRQSLSGNHLGRGQRRHRIRQVRGSYAATHFGRFRSQIGDQYIGFARPTKQASVIDCP